MPRADPAWWAEARRLRRKGLSYAAIARIVHRSEDGVRYAVNPLHRMIRAKFNREQEYIKMRKKIISTLEQAMETIYDLPR